MGTHTPGPWVASGEDRVVSETLLYCGDVAPAVGEYRGDIATIQSCNHLGRYAIGREEAAANARLMAAAPDLLEAAKIALAMLNRNLASEESCGQPFNGDDEHEAHRVLTAAIAKATGGKP